MEMMKPGIFSERNNERSTLLQPKTGDVIDTNSDDEGYRTPDNELHDIKYLPSRIMWDKMLLPARANKRTQNNDNALTKRMMGQDRMNHLVRFAKRTNGEEKLERHKYTPEDLVALDEVGRLNSWLEA